MSTTKAPAPSKGKKRKEEEVLSPATQTGETMLTMSEIDISPLNYRKYYSQPALEDFAKDLKRHGIIQPLLIRQMPSGRYELIVGERRFRAATIAGMTEVPVIVKACTDAEVRELQLVENIQREDPHPLHQAMAIQHMQEDGKPIDEIALRLGKSKTFVYSRIKLATLIVPFQDMFLADVITITEAVEVATLSEASQAALFEAYCIGWQDDKDFEVQNLESAISRYRYDLQQAPFDLNDAQLIPEAGACITCQFNTATIATLFPDLAEEAVCSNAECYQRKCDVQFVTTLTQALKESNPMRCSSRCERKKECRN